ncbi:MAG: CpsB/CapC family capsule biosynthesis tyrosine phosphatase [Candidatus Hodarchaeales archaeon]
MVVKIDYHVHTRFSDGYYSPEEMVMAAREKNVKKICITDHYSTMKPALSHFDLEEYVESLERIRKDLSRGIKLFIGIEVDMYSIHTFDELEKYNWDLVLFEYVFNSPEWKKNFQNVINFKKNYPHLNIGLAHTRFSRVSETKLDYVLNMLKKHRIIIELNTSYNNYLDTWFNYLNDEFWYSIGTDAHSKERLGEIDPAVYYLQSRNIPESQIIHLQ